jgi:acyl transferase domain-containing protein
MHKPVVEERVMERAVLDLVPPARLMSVGASDPGRVASLAAESNGTLFVAMDNCPNQVVLCGTPEAVEAARATLTDEGALCQFLPFDRGYHTPMYRPVCDMLENTTSSCEDRIPGIPVYCTTTGRRLPESAADIRRVMIDQWSEPIRFRETVETMHADGVRVFLEVGPRGNLTGFVDDTLSGRDHAAIPCNLQSRSGMEQLLHALGQLCAHGVPVNVSPLFVGRGAILLRPEEGPPKKPTRKKHVIRLKMDMPLVSLDEADSKLLRDSLTAALRSPDAVSETAASAPRKTVENPVGHAGDRPALDSHLRLMEELLATHEEVVLAAMDGRGSA